MNTRVGVVAIVIEDLSSAPAVNEILHNFSSIIVGRMGLPYKERKISVISIIIDGTTDEISSLTGKLGNLQNVSVKSALTKS
ncbi:TM1266 family iron-only hydrogenase system putative regulator [Clostridium uliginosum]|uniref:Putative iron-only hydrogenase system regulator n=1 Tax=Clostridium uliginosum TaxID=119641 RepID=A0A1I1SK24_9CLOT|nr:TM1266 family iron-only hydrogenase system putative regulator [Clostridium uliginosum]SFD45008.1 putative iron-only hydrogenase system regulator [Clostridium uliginosum]